MKWVVSIRRVLILCLCCGTQVFAALVKSSVSIFSDSQDKALHVFLGFYGFIAQIAMPFVADLEEEVRSYQVGNVLLKLS